MKYKEKRVSLIWNGKGELQPDFLQFFGIVGPNFAAVNQTFWYEWVYITTLRYILFPTTRIAGRIVQMYTDVLKKES